MKKLLSVLTTITILFSFSVFFKRIGTHASFNNTQSFNTNVYIRSTEEFKRFSKDFNTGKIPLHCNVYLDSKVKLDNTFMPIGTLDYPFCGTFEGNFNTVNFDVNSNASYAIFGSTNNAIIKDILTEGNVTALQAAGIVLCANNTSISNCVNNANITARTFPAGAIAIYTKNSKLFNCNNYAQISGIENVSGIVCVADNTEVSFCENAGMLSCSYGFAGGIVSIAKEKTRVTECKSNEEFFYWPINDTAIYERVPMTEFLEDIETAISYYNAGDSYSTRKFVIAQQLVGLSVGDNITIDKANKVLYCLGVFYDYI